MQHNEEVPESKEDLIKHYFRQGFADEKILLFLKQYHGIDISLRTLSTRLRSLGLRRRNIEFDLNSVCQRVHQELDEPGNSSGYRSITHTLQMEGIQVPRDPVVIVPSHIPCRWKAYRFPAKLSDLVKELDPESVNLRRSGTLRRRIYHSPGPNFVWHVDGYDKLKPYGFPVHGCIDGYSRKILWLYLLPFIYQQVM